MPRNSTLHFALFTSFLVLASPVMSQDSQSWQCALGLRFQRTWELYHENGLEVACTHQKVLGGAVEWVVHATSSRFGSALTSHALEQENYLTGFHWIFRRQALVRPWTGLEAGYFHLDTESPIFKDLPNQSALLALTGGILVPYGPVQWRLGIGFNVITGDGIQGPGTLYPLYGQTTVAIRLPWRNP